MNFADKLGKIADKNKPEELSVFEQFKKQVVTNYPSEMQLIKEHCLKLANNGIREYCMYYDDKIWGPYFNPYSLRNVKFSDASKACGYAKSCIAYLLEQEGFNDYDINTDLIDNSLSFFDDQWTFWIKWIKIRW